MSNIDFKNISEHMYNDFMENHDTQNNLWEKIDKIENKVLPNKKKSEIIFLTSELSKNIWDKYDVKLAINPNNNSFYLGINDSKLNIEITDIEKFKNIKNYLEKLITIQNNKDFWSIDKFKKFLSLWDNNIYLGWSAFWREIRVDDSVLPVALDSKLIDTDYTNLSKNEVEDLFKFTMKLNNIRIEDWDIESTVCHNNTITDDCKKNLGSYNSFEKEEKNK